MRAVSRFCTQLTVAAAAADDVTAVSGGITFLVIGFILGRPVDALCGSFKEDLSVSAGGKSDGSGYEGTIKRRILEAIFESNRSYGIEDFSRGVA